MLNVAAMTKDNTSEVIITEHDYHIFCASKAFINYVKEIGSEIGVHFDMWENNFEPGFLETKEGIIVEYTYHYPAMLYLPWGTWKFRKDFSHSPSGLLSNCGTKLHARLEEKMELKHLLTEVNGIYWIPVEKYSLMRIDDYEFPEATFIEDKEKYISKDKAKKIFGQLTSRWKEEHQEKERIQQTNHVPAAYFSTLGVIDI